MMFSQTLIKFGLALDFFLFFFLNHIIAAKKNKNKRKNTS